MSAGFIVLATMAVVLAGASTASAQDGLAASCGPQTGVSFADRGEGIAQVFTSRLSGGVTRAELELSRGDANDTATFVFAVFGATSAGVPTGAPLASTFVPAKRVGAAVRPVSGVFASPARVIAGRNYALVVRRVALSYGIGIRSDCEHGMFVRPFGARTWSEEPGRGAAHRVFVAPPQALICKGRPVTMLGTAGDDELIGTPRRDVIAGRGGDDEINSLAGDDLICGGSGKDLLRGGNGTDNLHGQAGRDRLRGGGGHGDRCNGGEKHDSARKCEVEKSI